MSLWQRLQDGEDDFYDDAFEDASLDADSIGAEGLVGLTFSDCTFTKCTFVEATWRRCSFVDCAFVGCDLSALKPHDTAFQRVRFEGCKALGVDWSLARQLSFEVTFTDCMVSYGSFYGVRARSLRMVRCKAHEVDFTGADLGGAVFEDTALDGSTFQRTKLVGADLNEATGYTVDPARNTLGDTTMSVEGALLSASCLGIRVA